MSFIETPRLFIRTWMASDAPGLVGIVDDEVTMRFVGDGGPWHDGRARDEIRWMTESYERDGYGVWPVVLKESGAIAGACGLRRCGATRQIELVCIFGRTLWGSGLAFEAATAVLEFGFHDICATEIIALSDRDDARWIRLIHRLGMRYDRIVRAYRRDLMRYVKTP